MIETPSKNLDVSHTQHKKNCALELHYHMMGPIRMSARLVLVDEFKRQAYHSVVPQWQAPKIMLPRTMALFAAIIVAPQLFPQLSNFLEDNLLKSSLYFLGVTEATLGQPSKFMRHRPTTKTEITNKPYASLSLTRDQYDLLRDELHGKRKYYSPFWNNCVRQCRREFNQAQERYTPDEKRIPVYRCRFFQKTATISP